MSAPPMLEKYLAALPEPVKNRFFYGMLLNEHVLTQDQFYFDHKRWLLNRLTLGKGVLSGLNYTANKDRAALLKPPVGAPDPAAPVSPPDPVRYVWLCPGVALDDFGREIVVPSTGCADDLVFPIEIDGPDGTPIRATNAKTFVAEALREIGTRPAEGDRNPDPFFLLFEIAYSTLRSDPAANLAGNCSSPCEPSATREGFRVRFRPLKAVKVKDEWRPDLPGPVPGAVDPVPGAVDEELPRSDDRWPAGSLIDVFPQEPPEAIRHRHLAQTHADLTALAVPSVPPAGPCDAPESWVSLGVFRCELPDGDPSKLTITHAGRYYRQLFSTDALSRLVVGLAERADEAARVRVVIHNGPPAACGEGQTADVYHELTDPLVVQVINSTGAVPKGDLNSIRVQFDCLTVSESAALLKDDGTPLTGPLELASNGTVKVRWRLGKRPGLHTVAARIVPAKPLAPPFHPGSQVLFHATARPTAPTIVGMELRHWFEHHGGCARWRHGKAVLRVFFSRKMNSDALMLKTPDPWLKVWRMVSGKSARRAGPGDQPSVGVPLGPEPMEEIVPHGHGPVGSDPDERACWYADYDVPNLLKHLCESDTLRVLVMIRPTDGLTSQVFPTNPLYPQPQQLDADFDGSFASPVYRDALWNDRAPDPALTAGAGYFHPYKDADWDKLPAVSAEQSSSLEAAWHRFQPREYPFPSGDGNEGLDVFPKSNQLCGGDFHKAFELRLPHC